MLRCGHRQLLAALAFASVACGGCEREDQVRTTLEEARIKLQAVAPGGGLSRPELRATTFREVSQSLRQVTTAEEATPGQVASAHLLIASAEAGLAAPKASETTTLLNRAAGLTRQIRTLSIERGAATSTATVLASYDPGPEIADIDRVIRDTQAEQEVAREDLAAVQEKMESLRSQAAAELEEARGLRAAEADIRNEALGMDDIGAAGLIADAARLGRQADAHEVAAANLEAEAEMLAPEAAQLELRIEGLLAQAAALNKAREGVGERGRTRSANAAKAGDRGKGYEGEIDGLVSELLDLSRTIATTATDAAESYEQAAASAARASQHARKAARATAGKARHTAASLRLALAEHLLNTAEALSGLAEAQPPLSSARTLTANAERLASDGLRELEAALEAYRSALSDLESAGAAESLVSAMNESIGAIEKRLQDAGVGGSGDTGEAPEPDPAEAPAQEPGEGAGEEPGETGGV